jgi:hypothetical protein
MAASTVLNTILRDARKSALLRMTAVCVMAAERGYAQTASTLLPSGSIRNAAK